MKIGFIFFCVETELIYTMYVAYHLKKICFLFFKLLFLASFSGVKVTKVTHDYHVSIMKYVTEEFGIF